MSKRSRKGISRNLPKKKKLMKGRQSSPCHWCSMRFEFYELTVDHVIPTGSGGPGGGHNTVLACVECNRCRGWIHEIVLGNMRRCRIGVLDHMEWWFFANRFKDPWLTHKRSRFVEQWLRRRRDIVDANRSAKLSTQIEGPIQGTES